MLWGMLRPLTVATMVAYVVVVYALVVVGGGALVDRPERPASRQSVLATAVVAITFEPVRGGIARRLARVLRRDRMTPYQVLAQFRLTATGAYPAAELPARMARALAEGTGAAAAQVWLTVHGRLELAATWPVDPAHHTDDAGSAAVPVKAASIHAASIHAALGEGRLGRCTGHPGPLKRRTLRPWSSRDRWRSLAVRERGELLGALAVVMRDGQELTPVEERLFAGLAAQSALMFRVAGLRAGLEQELVAVGGAPRSCARPGGTWSNGRTPSENGWSATFTTAPSSRSSPCWSICGWSSGCSGVLRTGRPAARPAGAAARESVDTLTALSSGLYPPMVTEAGPVAALSAALTDGPIPVALVSSRLPRCPSDVEAAVYFSCLEAVQNAGKHAGAAAVTIEIDGRFGADGTGEIDVTVADDGRGFDVAERTGSGLLNIRDRIESVQGTATQQGLDVNATGGGVDMQIQR